MTLHAALLLILSIVLSSGRNLFSKSISTVQSKTKTFYLLQAVIFGSGFVPLIFAADISSVSVITIILAVIYGLLLITAQWNYTIALQHGNVGVCATVYSLGFILPTLSGTIFWNEELSFLRGLGIITVIPAIILSGKSKGNGVGGNRYFLPLMMAMLSSGGLGIMQKVQQRTSYASERSEFVLLSFLIAAVLSLTRSFFAEKQEEIRITKKQVSFAAATGVCFAVCNLLNTTLAGLLDSAVLFPLLNVGTILFSLAMSVFMYGEKINRRTACILALGIGAIVLISM